MIVSPCFDDDSLEVAWRQHDVYESALNVIVQECLAGTRKAAELLGIEPPACAKNEIHFDHRTLQRVHDLLAAAWRYRSRAIKPELPLEPPNPSRWLSPTLVDEWIIWLQDEVLSWRDDPLLIRSVVLVLQHQYAQAGQNAENALIAALYDRFSDVPWLARFRKAHEDAVREFVRPRSLFQTEP